jgi:hypothetical protein
VKAPFPYFGGKRTIAETVWRAFGDLPGWTEHEWERGRLTYAGGKTTAKECIWFSPACLPLVSRQVDLFGGAK